MIFDLSGGAVQTRGQIARGEDRDETIRYSDAAAREAIRRTNQGIVGRTNQGFIRPREARAFPVARGPALRIPALRSAHGEDTGYSEDAVREAIRRTNELLRRPRRDEQAEMEDEPLGEIAIPLYEGPHNLDFTGEDSRFLIENLEMKSGFNSRFGSFYIYPREIEEYFKIHPELFDENHDLDLTRLAAIFMHFDENPLTFDELEPFPHIDRTGPDYNPDTFFKNIYCVLYAHKLGANIFGVLGDPRAGYHMIPKIMMGNILRICISDTYDLPNALMMYILITLCANVEKSSFILQYGFDTNNFFSPTSVPRFPINDERTGRPITITNGKISGYALTTIYMTILRKFIRLLPGGDNSTWNGSEESGVRILLNEMRGENGYLYLLLEGIASQNQRIAGRWTQKIEDFLTSTVSSSVMSVRNRDDDKCLIYCLIMGLILKIVDRRSRYFGLNTMMVEASEVYAKGMYMFTEDDIVSETIRKLTKLLFPPLYSEGTIDLPLLNLVSEIDKKVGTTLSMVEFNKFFSEVESKLIPKEVCGVDVYGMDYNISPHIYPLYISKNREGRIVELLCVTPRETNCSHFCVIVNMQKLLSRSGGKLFVSCTKCGQCFYHKRLLQDHHCPANPHINEVPGDGGYHYSSQYADSVCDIICGACPKCRLCFTDDFTFEYHKEHCLMQGQTGYRHVQLKSYKRDEKIVLRGQEIDMDLEDKHVRDRRMLYADFECSINPETGEHSFMSYGVYEWETNEYKCGYDLKEFIEYILEIAYSNEQTEIYVYFHNAMGYDANFILRQILRDPDYEKWGIQVIMKSSNRLQKLVLYTERNDMKRRIHIGDTFLFLTLSLERIVDSIRKDDVNLNIENFPRFFEIFHERYPHVTNLEIDKILRKNIFPYKFFTDSSKLDTPIEDFLKIFEPRLENLIFFSEKVGIDDLVLGFNETKHVIEVYGCRTARDYHDLYLCCDVMQLADVFDRSMNILWESHHIHLTKYIGMPSASWAAFLRHNPTMSIPLYDNTFFAEFFKGMVRGGITSAALRHAVADDEHSIIYLDVNGLYPYVMQAYDYPCGEFKFMPLGWVGELCKIKLEEYFAMLEREHKGMCFCVDMVIPDDVKELTDMYPFAPEHRRIYKEYYDDLETKELTPFLKRWSEANNGEKMQEFHGLVCTLYDKTKYNVHWKLLKFYMEHGVIITKVWFGVIFDEGDYLAGYIRKNIEIRNTRRDELGKTLYKLLGNSIYGKTFESPFKRNTYEIIRDKNKLQGLIEEGNIAAIVPIDDLGWIVRMDGEDIILDKPTYIGACVCEYSKLHMYTLLYDKLMKIFPGTSEDPGCQLVYTDTDSFIVRVKHPRDVGPSPKELFDYIKSQDPTLIGGIGGQVKSETGEDDTIQEVIALRSKVYAYVTKNGHIGKRAKGTTHDAQEMQLDWQAYKQALENLTSINTKNMQFFRNTFLIRSLEVSRQSLSVNDGKRYICDDGIHTHAFGYHKL